MIANYICDRCKKNLINSDKEIAIIYVGGERRIFHDTYCSVRQIVENRNEIERIEFVPINELEDFLEKDDYYVLPDFSF